MNTKEFTTEYRMKKWAEIIKDCKESGQSVKMYCANAGYHPNRYFYWQKKLREAAYESYVTLENKTNDIKPAGNIKINDTNTRITKTDSQKLAAGWVSVEVKNRNENRSQETAKINIQREGWTITVETGCDTGLLTETLKAVSRACC